MRPILCAICSSQRGDVFSYTWTNSTARVGTWAMIILHKVLAKAAFVFLSLNLMSSFV